MSLNCIPRDQAKQLIKDIQKIGFDDFSEMTPEARKKLFSKYMDDEMSGKIEDDFAKALNDDDFEAVINWAKKNLKPQEAEELAQMPPEEFIDMMDSGDINETLFKKQVGIELSTEELENFNRLGEEALELGKNIEKDGISELGNVLDESYSDQLSYFEKLKELNEYAESISANSSLWDSYTGNVWKAGVLATLKSFNLNVFTNKINMALERTVDRIANLTFGGALKKEKKLYIERGLNIYHKANFDISRSTGLSPEESVIGAGRVLGESVTTPQGAFMKKYTNFTWRYTLGMDDVFSGLMHRADSVGIQAQVYARKGLDLPGFEGLSGKELERAIFFDGIRIDPQTDIGKQIKELSIENAKIGTFTNETLLTQGTSKGKEALNLFGNSGEILIPFSKTPTNVIGLSAEYGGTGAAAVAVRRTFQFLLPEKVKIGDKVKKIRLKGDKVQFDKDIKSIIRAGMGTSFSMAIVAMIDIDDYAQSYDPRTTKERAVKGATPDSVKIKGKYTSLDYFGPLRWSIKMQLELKMKKNMYNAITATALSEIGNFPIFSATGITDAVKEGSKDEARLKNITDGFPNKILSHFYGALPFAAQTGDFANAMDSFQRDTSTEKYSFAGLDFDGIVSKIPILRETLPEKVSVLGDTLETTGFLNVLTGARASNAIDTPVVNEYRRLEDQGFHPNIPDITFSRSEKVSNIESEIGKEAMIGEKKIMGEKISAKLNSLINTKNYQSLVDEDRQDLQEKISKNEYERFLAKYDQGKFTELDTRKLFEDYILTGERVRKVSDELVNKSYTTDDSLFQDIELYARALQVDFPTAVDRMFNQAITGKKIRRIDSGAIIVERMNTGGKYGSQKIRKDRGFGGNDSVRLDHTVPLQLGGSNKKSNLKIVSTEEHAAYTPEENRLGRLLRDNKIGKKEAQETMAEFKMNWAGNNQKIESLKPRKAAFQAMSDTEKRTALKSLKERGFTREQVETALY